MSDKLDVKKLQICSLNCDSIYTLNRRTQLIQMINDSRPDIALLQETRLDSVNPLRINNYNVFRTHKVRQKEGLAIAIRNKFRASKLILDNFTFQTTAIVVKLGNGKEMIIITLHIPGKLF